MSSERETDPDMEIAHVLFIDIVGYSKLLVDEQSKLLQRLNQIVRASQQFRTAAAAGKLVRLPTGDGMALAFFSSPDAPVRCAIEVAEEAKATPNVPLRMGIHSGPVDAVADVNDRSNIAGAGINFAQRVMDCGDAGHILLSKRIADDLSQYGRWQPHLHDLGEVEAKHGVKISVVNLHNDVFGNANLPHALQKQRAAATDRTRASRRSKLKWSAATAITLLCLALAAHLYLRSSSARARAASISEKSVAVLPFENLSAEKENSFFAQGLHGEILISLSKISGLKVISRVSTMRYASRPDNLPAIAAELRVAHIIEGTVQKSGDRVRVHVQLIRANTDEQVWAESYDRGLTDIFAIEGEVAKDVAEALHATLTPSENESLTRPRTSNSEAYVFYLRGREYFDRVDRTREQYQAAERLFEQAIARDPNFAAAWALLSRTLISINFFFEATPDRKARARAAAEEAVRLQPDSGEAHRALAAIYGTYLEHDRRLAELQLAHRALPNDSEIISAMAGSYSAKGKWAEARAACERAVTLSPNDPRSLFDLSIVASRLRDWPTAASALDRVLALTPDATNTRMSRAWTEFFWHDDLRPMKEWLASIPPGTPDPDGTIAFDRAQLALFERDYILVEQIYAALPLEEVSGGASDRSQPKALHQAIVLLARGGDGDIERAQAYLQKARLFLEGEIAEDPQNPWAHADLGRVYAALGWRDAAVGEGLYAVELVPESKDARESPSFSETLAWIYARLGEPDAAIPLLDRLLRTPAGIPRALLRHDPEWDALRNDPRFQALVSGPEPKTVYN
jgi:serine/threonine-protein kinase